jgi:hypothetical protein
MRNEFEQQQSEFRRMLPQARSEDLLKFFEKTHWLLAQRAITAGVGIHDDNPHIERQYRLTAYAVEQELLKRLHVS